MASIEENLEKIESCIQMGHFSQAKSLMQSISLGQIPRSQLHRASNLSRRCGMIHRALKILGPLVLKQVHRDRPATQGEKADYAFSLNKIGLHREAENLLKPLREEEHAGALFFSSLVSFTRWEYELAFGYLNKFISREKVPLYRKMVGMSNLVSACIFLRKFEQAQEYLDQVIEYARLEDRKLLLNLGREQQAEIYVLTDRFQEARELLDQASSQSQDSGLLLNLWIAKWQAVMEAKSKRQPAGREALMNIFRRAESSREWETCRDVHYQYVSCYRDQDLYNKVYFGTPFESFKKRLEDLDHYLLPENYRLLLGSASEKSLVIDFIHGEIRQNKRNNVLNLTESEWGILSSLSSDFYKPIKVGELFGEIIQEEYYDPFTSPNRIHQSIYRLNEKFENANLDIKIMGSPFGYKFYSKGTLSLILNKTMEPLRLECKQLKELSKSLDKAQGFKATQVSSVLQMSERSANRWLKQRVDNKDLIRLGRGKNTRYCFPSYKKAS